MTINTIQELLDSKLPCGGWGDVNLEFFKTSLDPATQAIGAKFEAVNNATEAVEKVAEGNFALYENIYFLKEVSVARQLLVESLTTVNSSTTESSITKGERHLHIMKDCVINMPISIGLQKNSPLKPRIDKYIRRVLEAGLIRKWLDDVMQPTLNAQKPANQQGNKAVMDTQKFIGAVVALFIGYFISFVAFFIEIGYFNYVVKKNPRFDKYLRRIHT